MISKSEQTSISGSVGSSGSDSDSGSGSGSISGSSSGSISGSSKLNTAFLDPRGTSTTKLLSCGEASNLLVGNTYMTSAVCQKQISKGGCMNSIL